MGRSGGGRRGGGSRSHARPHGHRNMHHHHSHHRRGYGGSYGGGGHESVPPNPNAPIILSIVLAVVIAIIMVCVVVSDVLTNSAYDNPELSPQEQYIWCGSKKIELEYSSRYIKVYESLTGEPETSNETRSINATLSGIGSYDTYKFRSFFLAPGSHLSGSKQDHSSKFIVIKGTKNMIDYENDRSYEYIIKGSEYTFSLSITEFDEYFVVLEGTSSSRFSANLFATLAVYETENLVEKCTANSKKCTLNANKDPNFCVVIDYDTKNSYPNVEITIDDGSGPKIGAQSISGIVVCVILIIGVLCLGVWLRKKSIAKKAEFDAKAASNTNSGEATGTIDASEVYAASSQPQGTVTINMDAYSTGVQTDAGTVTATATMPPPVGYSGGMDYSYPTGGVGGGYTMNDVQYPTAPPPSGY